MRVHLIKEKTIEDFVLNHASSKSSFETWLTNIKGADWSIADDIKATFGTADILGNGSNRVVFDIGGNNFRLIGKYSFGKQNVHLFVCWIGKHSEYDELCKKGKQYTINVY